MTFRHIHLAAAAVLAGLALTLSGCSDSGSTDAGKQPTTQQYTTQQSAPTAPTGDGSAEGFCAAIENGGGVDLSNWSQSQKDPALREKLIKRFNALVDAAPNELKPSMQDVAAGYEELSAGKVSEADQAKIAKYAKGITALNAWMQTNCPNLKKPTAG